MNHISLTGRLTRDPELRALPSGDSACQMRLAVDQMAPGREAGYIDVATFGKAGEAAARVLTRGWLVSVDGRLEHRTWQAKDDTSRQSYTVIGSVEFLAAPRSAQPDEGSDSSSAAGKEPHAA
jgi:single-strand DNA-binding protein